MTKYNEKPLLIVLTPVKNEAWILDVFLKATSLWADYIVIADQNSTDGSRMIAKKYPKVILVDNQNKEMHQANARKLLFNEVKKIEGDKILFGLDADEFLSGDFIHTQDWQHILNSQPNDMFLFRWMNLQENISKYTSWTPYYWAVHASDSLWDSKFMDNFIHEWRLPCPDDTLKNAYTCTEINFIHFARTNKARQKNKERFYQVVSLTNNSLYNPINLFRQYHVKISSTEIKDVPSDAFVYYEQNGLDIKSEINFKDEGIHYIQDTLLYFQKKGITYYKLLDIWDKSFLKQNKINDPRLFCDKVLYMYLKWTNPFSNWIIIRKLDCYLSRIISYRKHK